MVAAGWLHFLSESHAGHHDSLSCSAHAWRHALSESGCWCSLASASHERQGKSCPFRRQIGNDKEEHEALDPESRDRPFRQADILREAARARLAQQDSVQSHEPRQRFRLRREHSTALSPVFGR